MQVFALLSDQRAHKSASPKMHNNVIAARGLSAEYSYVALEIHEEDFEAAMAGFRALNLAGANVTVPYKEKIIPYLDSVSERAAVAGAVNTVIRDGQRLIGDNTDIGGFLDALELNNISAAGKNICLIGNGGAARGLLVGLRSAAAGKITVVGRSLERAEPLATEFGVAADTLDNIKALAAEADIIVNSSAVSCAAEAPEMAVILGEVRAVKLECVVDINYGRNDNFWEKLACSSGAVFVDGLPMLALQARLSFQLWTGLEVEKAEYLRALGL